MALTLRDASTGLQLRDSYLSPRQSGLFADQLEAADTNPVTRGWNAADIGIEASDLMAQANAAERAGDPLLSQSLQQRARDQMARAQAWAPETQSFRDIDSPGSAADWLGGAVGGIRSSVGPLVGGAAGALAGTAVGLATRNPQLGVRAAQLLAPAGAFTPGYDLMYDESISQSMMDPAVRARSTPEEMHRAAQGVGVVGGALEAFVPAGVGKLAVQGLGKRTLGQVARREAGEEFLTEGAQALVGQTAQNQLRGDPLAQYDYGEALDAAMAGAVGGGVMGGGGAAIGAARDKLVGGTQAVAGTVGDVARDPTGVVIDAMKRRAEKSGRKQAQDEIDSMTDDEVIARVMGRKGPSVTDPLRDNEREMDDRALGAQRAEEARTDAEQVLRSHPREHSGEERQAAAEFLAGNMTWDKYREARRAPDADRKAQQETDELFSAMGLDDAKYSLMSPTLTDDFGEQEGRDMDADTVVDDQGNVVRRASSRTNTLPADERGFGSALRRVAALEKNYSAKATKEDAQRTVKVADVLLKNNYFPKEVVETAKTASQKDALLSSTAALVSWMKYGMQGDANQLHAMAKIYGDKILPVLDAAYEAGVNAGVVPRNPERFAEVSKVLTQEHASLKQLGDMLLSKINPAYATELKSMSKKQLASTVNEVMRLVTTEGDRANAALKEMFPDEQNRAEVTEAFYNVQMARNAYGTESRASQPVRDEGDGTERTEKSFEVDERDDMSQKGEAFEGQATGQKVEYLTRSRGHSFNRKDPTHRAELAKARGDALRRESNVANPARVEEVGAIDRALERAEKANGGALSDEQRFRAIEKEVKKHTRKSLERPTEPPEAASDTAKRMYAQDYARYQKRVRAAAVGVNKRYVYLKRTETAAGELASAIDLEAILANERKVKLDDPRNGIPNGTMWFEKATGGKFIINAPQITRLMFQRNGEDGDPGLNHEVGKGEDKGPLSKGGQQHVLEMFHEGVASILEHDYFTGKFGYVRAGEAVSVEGITGTFPSDFKLSSKVTYGQGLESKKGFASKIEGNDFDSEEMGLPTRRLQATVWQKLSALRVAAKKLNGEEGAKLRAMLGSLYEIVTRRKGEGAKGDDLVPRDYHKLISKWMAALNLKAGTIDVAKPPITKERAQDGLQAYDPEALIIRDEKGLAQTDNAEMVAASHVGRSMKGTKPVAERKVGDKIVDEPITENVKDQGGVATSKTPDRKRDGVTDTQLEAGKQEFVRLMRESAQAVVEAIEKMSGKELTLFETAFEEFSKLSATNVDALAKDYFQGEENAARMFTTRLMRSNVAIQSSIKTRKDELNGRVATGDEEAFGEGRQANPRGQKARVVARDNGQRAAKGSELRSGDAQRSANRAAGGRGLLEKLKGVKAKNEFHRRAVAKAVAILDGTKQGSLVDALKGMLRWDQTLGELSQRQRDALQAAVEARGERFEEIPIEAYADERITEYDDADIEADRAAFEGDGETKYSEQTTGEANEQADGQNGRAEGGRVQSAPLIGVSGGLEGLIAKHGKAFARRVAEISRTFRFENPNEQVNHNTSLGNFQSYSTISSYVVEQGMFIMYVLPETSAIEARGYLKDASANGVKMTHTLRNRILGHTSIMRLGYDPSTNEFVWLSADKGSFGERVLAQNDMLDEPTLDRSGRELNKTKGLKFAQITKLLGEFHARLRDANGGEEVLINWDRYTGANTSKKGETQFSEQTAANQEHLNADEALAYLAKVFGKDFDAEVVASLGGKAGKWTKHGIKLAASAPNGVQYHEALHEFFAQLRKHGADNVRELIQRVAANPIIMRKLEQLLEGHPKARKQLKTPEEAAAYLFQFWNMGLINVGPETKTLFQTIKDFIASALKTMHGLINAGAREQNIKDKAARLDQEEARRAFEALNGGNFADPTARQAAYDALRKNAEAHAKAVEELGQRGEKFWQGLGRYVVTSESMLNLYSMHPELKVVADKFHQMAGKSMKNQARNDTLDARGGLMEATHGETQTRLNKFERFLQDGKYDEKDIELAMPHLERGSTNSTDPKVAKLVTFARDYMAEMYDYMVQSDVRRLDPTSEERWVPVQKRKDYFTQSWAIEALTKDHDGFIKTLLEKHPNELAHMVQQANAEIAAWNSDRRGKLTSPTAQALAEKQEKAFAESGQVMAKSEPLPNVTPELIAEQIYTRLLNSTGLVDIQESEWSLGLTPAAAAVNRRELDWLDKDAFSKYKSKDLVEIMTNYTRTMVKRAEYQKRFGYGGEVIGEAMDTAFLREVGGHELVKQAQRSLPVAIKAWKKAAQEWHADNGDTPYPEPYPTLRMVGIDAYRASNGNEKANEALIKAEKALRPAVNAVRAMEGTLGNDINQNLRSVNSWINTYQNVRLLPFALFTNFSDVIGLTVQGGTLGDAWDAFVSGIREVRNTWVNEKGSDSRTLRAEEWGVSDAGALLDTLGQNYSSVYMSEKARKVNNTFFRVIGMEGWNRGVRIAATALGERVVGDWAKNGVDAKKPGEKKRFERLYGEGADPKAIKLDAEGNLDANDAANRAAIQRFVQDAVMSSNSAVRTAWMSDPRFATFAHLKNFAYAFHSVMLKGVLGQAAEGNFRPALVAGLGFTSISIAAAAVKEMLIPGEEPPWMQGGLDGYLDYGLGQANLGGVPQMWGDGVRQLDPAKLAGPFWDQIQNTISSPIPGLSINLSPFDGETELLRDRKVAVELAKALPAGNIAGRYMESALSD